MSTAPQQPAGEPTVTEGKNLGTKASDEVGNRIAVNAALLRLFKGQYRNSGDRHSDSLFVRDYIEGLQDSRESAVREAVEEAIQENDEDHALHDDWCQREMKAACEAIRSTPDWDKRAWPSSKDRVWVAAAIKSAVAPLEAEIARLKAEINDVYIPTQHRLEDGYDQKCDEVRTLRTANAALEKRVKEMEQQLEAHRLLVGKLREALRYLLDCADCPPAANCACHINPPCNDCTDYGALREARSMAEKALALTPETFLPQPPANQGEKKL